MPDDGSADLGLRPAPRELEAEPAGSGTKLEHAALRRRLRLEERQQRVRRLTEQAALIEPE